jgi:hypothetical protein
MIPESRPSAVNRIASASGLGACGNIEGLGRESEGLFVHHITHEAPIEVIGTSGFPCTLDSCEDDEE